MFWSCPGTAQQQRMIALFDSSNRLVSDQIHLARDARIEISSSLVNHLSSCENFNSYHLSCLLPYWFGQGYGWWMCIVSVCSVCVKCKTINKNRSTINNLVSGNWPRCAADPVLPPPVFVRAGEIKTPEFVVDGWTAAG